jgi:hypothetical protein
MLGLCLHDSPRYMASGYNVTLLGPEYDWEYPHERGLVNVQIYLFHVETAIKKYCILKWPL